MATEEWIVEARFFGDFSFSTSRTQSTPRPDGLQRLSVKLDEDKAAKLTGLKRLTATIAIPNDTGSSLPPDLVYDEAKAVVDNIVALIALATGRPVRLEGGVSAKLLLRASPNKYRMINGGPRYAHLIPLPSTLPCLSCPSTTRYAGSSGGGQGASLSEIPSTV